MKYKEFLQMKDDRLKNIPFFFAIGQISLEEKLKQFGWSIDEVVQDVTGLITHVSHVEDLLNHLKWKSEALRTITENDEIFFDALCYELINHECVYTRDVNPAIRALGLTSGELSDMQLSILSRAWEHVNLRDDL